MMQKRCNNIGDDINAIFKSRTTKARTCMIDILKQFREISVEPETDGEQPDTTDMPDLKSKESTEQPGTTDMPDLESEESAEQRQNQERQGIKILTPDQVLSRLPISLAQLKAGNN